METQAGEYVFKGHHRTAIFEDQVSCVNFYILYIKKKRMKPVKSVALLQIKKSEYTLLLLLLQSITVSDLSLEVN